MPDDLRGHDYPEKSRPITLSYRGVREPFQKAEEPFKSLGKESILPGGEMTAPTRFRPAPGGPCGKPCGSPGGSLRFCRTVYGPAGDIGKATAQPVQPGEPPAYPDAADLPPGLHHGIDVHPEEKQDALHHRNRPLPWFTIPHQ